LIRGTGRNKKKVQYRQDRNRNYFFHLAILYHKELMNPHFYSGDAPHASRHALHASRFSPASRFTLKAL
jgi:hypothetical protein